MTLISDFSLTGRKSEHPIVSAFNRKETAHVQVIGAPVMPDDQQQLWQQLSQKKAVNGPRLAYIHIPFCRTKCSYCAFYQNRTCDDKVVRYLDALLGELALSANQPGLTGAPFDGVYLGGGTPSDLSPRQIIALGEAIHRYLPLKTDAELTFEARFHGFDDERFQACLDVGFNRFSLGLQSFDTELRQRLGRIDDQTVVRHALDRMCNQDKAVIVTDLIYGLPGQTLEHWQRDLDMLVETGVGGADLYQLILLPQSQLGYAVNKGKAPPPPGLNEKAAMFEAGRQTLARHHFNRLSVSHFGRDRRERNRYNHLSKAGVDLIPFGCGAGGRIHNHSIMTERDLAKYHQQIAAGNKPIAMMTTPHPQHDLRYGIGAGIDLGYLDLKKLDELGELSIKANPLFDAWFENGLVQRDDRYLNLTDAGQFWNINLQQALNRYLDLCDEQQQRQELNKMNNTLEQIETISKLQPMSSIAQIGRQLGLTELEAIQALPAEQAQLVDGANFDRLMAELSDFGPTTTVIEVAGQILEYKGDFPEGSYGHGFYNLKGEHLRGHLNPQEVYAIGFIRRPFMRMETRAIWLFNGQGQCSFKVYLGRDDKRQLLPDQVAKFNALEQEFKLNAPLQAILHDAVEVVASNDDEQQCKESTICPISGMQFKQELPLAEQQAILTKSRCPMKRLFNK